VQIVDWYQYFGGIIVSIFRVTFIFIFSLYFILISYLPHILFRFENIPRLACAGATVIFTASFFARLKSVNWRKCQQLSSKCWYPPKPLRRWYKPYSMICLDYSWIFHHVELAFSWRNWKVIQSSNVKVLIIKQTRYTNPQIYFWNKILHVSDSSSVHHQEFFTVNTAVLYVMQVCWQLAVGKCQSTFKCSIRSTVSQWVPRGNNLPFKYRMVYCTTASLWNHKYGHFNLFTSNKEIISQNIRTIDKVWSSQLTFLEPGRWE